MLGLWFGLAVYFNGMGQQLLSTCFVLLYGMQANFLINGMHELGHGTVFQTKWLNAFFLRVVSFLGWLQPDMFFSSHLRHHRYTQNFPHDQENPMPVLFTWMDFVKFGFVNVTGFYEILDQTIRSATGVYPVRHLGWLPGWEEICYPTNNPAARQPPMRWAQFMLLGHGAFAYFCIMRGQYLAPFLLSLGPFYNGWLFWLCNSTQHIGLPHGNFGTETVNDFRLNTRTFYLNNSLVRFWYWHMNYHTEHHMYAAVPCYHLAELHQAIKHELPPSPDGLVEVWTVCVLHVAMSHRLSTLCASVYQLCCPYRSFPVVSRSRRPIHSTCRRLSFLRQRARKSASSSRARARRTR
jgi:fatty acid desaturase